LAFNNSPAGIIDLGGTKIYSAVVDGSGAVIGEDLRPTNAAAGQDAVIDAMVVSLGAAADAAGLVPASLCGAGVAAPGPVDAIRGNLTNPPNLPGWESVPLADLLSLRLGVPVVLENDGNAAAYGEYLQGAGRDAQALIYVTVSTGIGGGIVLDGELYRGPDGAAGEIGHMVIQPGGSRCGCGRLGCLEAMASGTAIAREGRKAVEGGSAPLLARIWSRLGEEISAELVAQAASEGDGGASEVLQGAGEMLGIGLGNLVNLLNPDVIVVGGGVAKIGPPLLEPAETRMRSIAFPLHNSRVTLRPSELEYPALHGLVGLIRAATV
jgi:glucokinase